MALDDVEDAMIEDEEYDEEADSDFNADAAQDDPESSGSEEGPPSKPANHHVESKGRQHQHDLTASSQLQLDSGDEATINEVAKRHKKPKKKGNFTQNDDSGNESEGWKARTRAMRAQDKEERKRNKLATSKGSTIDVEKIWEEMNNPGLFLSVGISNKEAGSIDEASSVPQITAEPVNKHHAPASEPEEMITIKRKFQFAGEVHVEEKTVPRTSAEAQLWLSQQELKPQAQTEDSALMQRPLRKISRFDPNYNNLAAFKTDWSRSAGTDEPFKGPRLNVVEKSKMDWAAHVDAEGLKDELDTHAKAKEGYHSRMDFLSQVEQRKDEEARLARVQG